MHQQHGAAPIVVLSLVSRTVLLSLSGFRFTLVSERLAGNYRARAKPRGAPSWIFLCLR